MAYPTLQFARLSYNSADFFSDENNQNGFIRINADTTNGSPRITNVAEQSGGAFTTSELMVGMTLVSSGEFSGDVTITNLDLGLDFINALAPKKYKYKPELKEDDGKYGFGFIAEEIETLLENEGQSN